MSTTVYIHFNPRNVRYAEPPRSAPIPIVQPPEQQRTRVIMRPRFVGDDFIYIPERVPVDPPARTTVGADLLGILVEVDCVAIVRGDG